ncbi:alpha/beta hydrolase [Pseudonocardia sp. EC080610-09]|uniref:alpha/beta fold hydrolase n=1 Tax=unclassified Pseudonocardia TaxID=2619320 RepID=UPI0006CB3286|nr:MULTISPECIES: alpha/beta hydrolase [unclassified Pseudonocardia]ALE75268.1 alpha/beta hydrolase [Pseudonocardia sp. EC080625-04]ALL74629.1 alpha/beta hydrolase [Pseudonocardia sp. EC080610-09]ALL81651.1 alpha/beta hydrolase [Pseudonocardia sp. EC080619-01]
MAGAPDPSVVRIPGPWTHRAVSANGIRIHLAEHGPPDGPLVVLLHGFPEFWWTWRHQLLALGDAGYRAVAPDLRGYGDTDKTPRGYDLWTLAGDCAGLVRALGERRAHVVGHDWGAAIAWTVAALHPRLVASLTVLGAPHPTTMRDALLRDPLGQGRASRYMAGFQLPRLPERSLRGPDRVERIMRDWAGPDWTSTEDFSETVARNREAIRISTVAHCSLEYYRWSLRSQFRPDGHRFARDVAGPVGVPVLQVHGADDPCVLDTTMRRTARRAGAGFVHHALPATGHFPQEERPTHVSALIGAHLERSTRDRPA